MTRILVVEDEAVVAMGLSRTLAQMGHEVLGPVATGNEAVRRALEESPDLLLMDVRLRGEMDGIAAVEGIRSQRDIPVIYLTAYSDVETLRRAKATRPLGYLVKPYDERELGAAIEVALYNNKLEKEQARVEQALHRSEAKYRLLAENATDIIALTTPDGIIEYVSPACAGMLGYAPEELVGQSGTRFIYPPDFQRLLQTQDENATKAPAAFPAWTVTYRARRHDGSLVWLESAIRQFEPPEDAARQVILSVTRDVTERVKQQDEIRQLNAELEERIERRTRELSAANRELEAFNSSVAHDIRGPLRRIEILVSVLEENLGTSASTEGRETLERLKREARQLGRLVDDLLRLSRATQGRLLYAEVDLSAMVRDILDDIQRSEPQRTVEILVEEGLQVVGDPDLLSVALANLLTNAWKYTARTQDARIEFGARRGNAETEFFVRDNGVGFDPAEAPRLFQPFQRLSTARGYAGTGIGLTTVHRIIDRHGGRIFAEGGVGEGAAFFFTIPPTAEPTTTPRFASDDPGAPDRQGPTHGEAPTDLPGG